MNQNRFPSVPAPCGRADLVRALAGSEAALEAIAELLGYERADDGGGLTGGGPLEIEAVSDSVRFTVSLETEPRSLPLSETPFWYLAAVAYREEGCAGAPQEEGDGSTELPVWAQGPSAQPPLRELAAWRDLVPRLRRTMTECCDSRAPDVPAIVERLSCGASLERLPRRAHRRWGRGATVIEDRSDRLIPYWRDQSRVRARLARLFPRHVFDRWIYWEGFAAPVPAPVDGGIEGRAGRTPPPGSLVVVLGDLGLLARSGENVRRYWAGFGRRLRDTGCRTVALTPADPSFYPASLSRHWHLVAWERAAGLAPGARCDAAVSHLLALLSPASRIEPGLLREMRLCAGYDAATEAVFWQHPALASNSSVAATLDAKAARGLRAEFANQPEVAQVEVLKAIRRWRGGLPPEIWYAEIQGLKRASRDRLIDPQDLRLSQAFFAALGQRSRGVGGPAVPEGVAAWFRFVEARLPDDYRDDPELGEHFERLWRLAHAHEAQSESVRNYDPGRFPAQRSPRRVTAWQQGDALYCAEATGQAESLQAGSPVAWFETRNGEIQIEPLPADPDPNTFWKSNQPPSWADGWGTDERGHWASFSVADRQGQKVTQKMRWIEPGEFLMGSPEDEPERSNAEGPRHPVTIRQGFWLSDTACTQALWQAVMGENPSRFKGAGRPVENVSWNDCQTFIERLNGRLPRLDLALPSEAQWEYACRAGTTTPFSFGDNITPEQVNYDGSRPYAGGKKGQYRQQTVPVASLPPNPWGLHEMHGNVWEWCQDRWHGDYRGAPADGSAWEDRDAGAVRVLRGGSWNVVARGVRAAFRYASPPDFRNVSIGFRCARVRVASPASQEGAEPAGPARGRQAERRPEQGPPGGATGAIKPTLLRLDAGPAPLGCPLPQTPAFFIRTDRERLTLRRLTKPAWASGIGRDRFGLWCEIEIDPGRGEPVVQRLRWIPPGRFWMGSPEEEPGRYDDEGPRHQVTLTEGYWLSDTPCTQALWEAVMGKNPSRFQSPTRPVERVSWDDARDFLKQLNGRIADLNLALPSEAQWEYACRAGTETAIHTGALDILGENNAPALDPIAWYGGNSGVDFDLDNGHDSSDWLEKQYPHTRAGTRPVKLKRANPWGLYDLLGNVWEWCQDGMRDYDQDARTNPLGSLDNGAGRVLRGGSWGADARFVRAACRDAGRPGSRDVDVDVDVGFRCARVRPEPGQPAGQSGAARTEDGPAGGAPGR